MTPRRVFFFSVSIRYLVVDCFQEALINKVNEFIMSVTTTLPPLFMRSLLFIFANLFHRRGDVHGGGMFFLFVQTTKSKERGERGKQDKSAEKGK